LAPFFVGVAWLPSFIPVMAPGDDADVSLALFVDVRWDAWGGESIEAVPNGTPSGW
jgi:hypothetical protein